MKTRYTDGSGWLLPFAIDGSRSETLTSQVAVGLRQAIGSGFFKVGCALPSRQAIAAELGVSECVVRAALQTLVSDRLVCGGRPRIGFRVQALPRIVSKKLVLDVSTENGGAYSSRVSTVECLRRIVAGGHVARQVVLGADARGTPYLKPLKEALAQSPDFVIVRTTASRRQVVVRMVAERGCPYATITLGRTGRSPGRFAGNLALDPTQALSNMADDCLRAGVRSVLQVDFGPDTYVDAEPVLSDRGVFVERLCVPLAGIKSLDEVVAAACDSLNRRLRRGGVPDLVFATDDYLSLGVREALRRNRLEPPRDVRLVVYDNVGSGLFPFGDLARIEFDPKCDGREIGRCVVEWLNTGTLGVYASSFAYRCGASFSA